MKFLVINTSKFTEVNLYVLMYKSSYRNNPILQIIHPWYHHSYDPWYLFEIFRYHFDSSLHPSNLLPHFRGKDQTLLTHRPPRLHDRLKTTALPQRLSYGHVIVAARSMAAWLIETPPGHPPLAPRLSSWVDPSGPVDGSEIPNNHLDRYETLETWDVFYIFQLVQDFFHQQYVYNSLSK